MKKIIMLFTAVAFLAMSIAAFATAKDEAAKGFKAGDKVYVCMCGKACKCGTVSYKAAKCGCGKELVETTITKVENDTLYYNIDGKELSAPAKGKYICGCGPGCGCGTISQKPGKCACGKAMKKIE